MGSGFSSFALRTFKQLQNLDTNIISVDTNDFWLNKTRKFCSKNKLIDDNFELWDNFKNTDKQFDLIFFDMDANRNRPTYFPIIFEQLSRFGCLILVDDLHKPGMKKGLKKYLATNKIGNFDIINQTLDSLNRFSTLLRVFR
jgi:predicted O-methyltransferase YrrM